VRELCIRGECRDAWVTVARIWFCPGLARLSLTFKSLTRLTNMIVEVMRTNTCRMENAGRCRAQRHMDFRFHRAGRIAGRIHLIYQKTGILVTRISLFRFAILYGLVRRRDTGFYIGPTHDISSSGLLCYRGFAEAGAGGLAACALCQSEGLDKDGIVGTGFRSFRRRTGRARRGRS